MANLFGRGRPARWSESQGMKTIPKAAGAYRFVRIGVKTVDYIGITSNLYDRIANHRSTKHYYNRDVHLVEYQVARGEHDWAQLCDWETRKIGVHRPTLNKTRGGNGRVAEVYLEGKQLVVSPKESLEDAAVRVGLLLWITDFIRRQ